MTANRFTERLPDCRFFRVLSVFFSRVFVFWLAVFFYITTFQLISDGIWNGAFWKKKIRWPSSNKQYIMNNNNNSKIKLMKSHTKECIILIWSAHHANKVGFHLWITNDLVNIFVIFCGFRYNNREKNGP